MILGTYIDGRLLGYDEATYGFDIGGTPLSPFDVQASDQAGHFVWGSEDQRRWFYQVGPEAFVRAAEAARADAYEYAAQPSAQPAQYAVPTTSAQVDAYVAKTTARRDSRKDRKIAVALVIIAVVALLGAVLLGQLAASRVYDGMRQGQVTLNGPVNGSYEYRT